ncbi:hypothetical protein HK100_008710, partial [Physocladia obscura]
MGISPHPKHCILPRSTGTFLAISDLLPSITDVFDLTISYSSVPAPSHRTTEIFQILSPDRMFLERQSPKTIHLHFKKYSVYQIPGFRIDDMRESQDHRKALFDIWLRGVWLKKDESLDMFYKYGELSLAAKEPRLKVKLAPRFIDWLYLGGL